jgi:hypothetical protein
MIFACGFAMALSGAANAAPIQYIFSGTATGTVGATPFSNASLTVVLDGDTNTISPVNGLGQRNNSVVGTITISGIGTATISEQIVVTSACGAGLLIGMERGPGSTPFPNFAFSTGPVPVVPYCALGFAPAIGLATSNVQNFTNLASTLGPITVTALSPMTYAAIAGASVSVPTLSGTGLMLTILMLLCMTALGVKRGA